MLGLADTRSLSTDLFKTCPFGVYKMELSNLCGLRAALTNAIALFRLRDTLSHQSTVG